MNNNFARRGIAAGADKIKTVRPLWYDGQIYHICISGSRAVQKRRIVGKEKRQNQNRVQAASLMKELREYENQGTHLFLGSRPSRAEEIVRACLIAEDSGYMRDFVSDDREHITEIHFIRISEKRKN